MMIDMLDSEQAMRDYERELEAAALKRGMERGMAKGLEQGVEQGRLEALAESVRALEASGMGRDEAVEALRVPAAERGPLAAMLG